jgi:hypothetical protein
MENVQLVGSNLTSPAPYDSTMGNIELLGLT